MSEIMDRNATTYQIAKGVRWAVESRGLLLSDSEGSTYRLGYPESALWDLFSRGCRPQKAASMLRYIASVPEEEAWQVVLGTLEEWVHLGLMEGQ